MADIFLARGTALPLVGSDRRRHGAVNEIQVIGALALHDHGLQVADSSLPGAGDFHRLCFLSLKIIADTATATLGKDRCFREPAAG